MRAALLILSLLVGCADAERSAAPCQAAVDHLAACEGDDPAPAVAGCDPDTARTILETPCDQLNAGLGDAKSDGLGFRRWACARGIYRYCASPACEAEADEVGLGPAPEATGSACLEDALAYRGCGACAYYACREATAACGADGYLLRFAEKYCLRYRLVAEEHASPAGQRWLRDIRRCLVERLDATAPGDDCAAIERAGFASHPECYLSTGFCDLPARDWLLVLNTIDGRDTNAREMLVTGLGCLREWLGG